jgi:thioredoxin 1
MSAVKEVNGDSFKAEVLESKVPVLVDFFATWCGPCRLLAPIVEEIGKEKGAALKVVKVDVDEAQDTALALGIQSVPTLVLFKGGQEAYRRVGAAPKRELVADLDEHLKA